MSRTIFSYLKEITNHNGFKAYLDSINANLYDEKDIIENKLDVMYGYESEDGLLTEKWINEKFEKEDSMFYLLSPFHKRILLYYYQEDINDKTIGLMLNKHINTINQHKRKANKIVGQEYNLISIRHRIPQRNDLVV